MSKAEKLLAAIRNNRRGVRFDDLVRRLEALGFTCDRQKGSHAIYVHANPAVPFVNLQPGSNGMAKVYQVDQVLEIVDAHGLEVK
jgi:predicted RNA binding protein YcfA (HicA-like mRNA interferase family)